MLRSHIFVIFAASMIVETRTAELAAMLDAPEPDVAQMMTTGRMLAEAEAELKVRHLELLLRVHACLTPGQRELLRTRSSR